MTCKELIEERRRLLKIADSLVCIYENVLQGRLAGMSECRKSKLREILVGAIVSELTKSPLTTSLPMHKQNGICMMSFIRDSCCLFELPPILHEGITKLLYMADKYGDEFLDWGLPKFNDIYEKSILDNWREGLLDINDINRCSKEALV